MIVVADTSPLNYLILIDHIAVLESIYGEVVVPPAVQDEMLSRFAPAVVRTWMENAPGWLEVRTPRSINTSLNPALGAGERETITLVQTGGLGSVLLIDERLGRQEARKLGLRLTGTLGILEEAHKLGLLNLRNAIDKLRATNFKASEALLRQFTD